MNANRPAFKITTLLLCLLPIAVAQTAWTQSADAQPQIPASTEPDAPPPIRDALHSTTAQNIDDAWTKLMDAVHEPKHPEIRIQALAALGTLGNNARAEKLIAASMKDTDVDVRTAAALAAGETYSMAKSRGLIGPLRELLNDKEPQVAFIAATTLWKMQDHSGADILMAVIEGDRKANAGLVHGTMHTVSKDLHSPSTLARIGALQGAAMLLGPFGFGITAYEYVRKNGGDSARAAAVDLVSQQKTPVVRKAMVDALDDKDPAVRAAAAKALGQYREREVSNVLLPLFADPKVPVRLTAAAAYLRTTSGALSVPANTSAATIKKP